jgi:hypothetical protein
VRVKQTLLSTPGKWQYKSNSSGRKQKSTASVMYLLNYISLFILFKKILTTRAAS